MNKIDFILGFAHEAKIRGLTTRDAIGLVALAKITSTTKECTQNQIFKITADKGMGATLSALKSLVKKREIVNDKGHYVYMYSLTEQGIDVVKTIINPNQSFLDPNGSNP